MAAFAGPIRNDGRGWRNDAGRFRIRFASGFTLTKLYAQGGEAQADAFLDWAAATGFNGVRTFVVGPPGSWNEVSIPDGLGGLDVALGRAADRGLYLEASVITGSKDFPANTDWRSVVQAAGLLCESHGNGILEDANEFQHASQASAVHDPENLIRWAQGVPVPWAIGAPDGEQDEPVNGVFIGAGGTQICAHLNRGRDFWNQVRRVRELFAIYEAHKVGVINNEPIGADEVAQPSRRESNPVFYLTLGVLNRCFEIGGVFHSQAGLRCEIPGPGQQACAEAFVRGSTFTARDEIFEYKNAGHAGSPIASANLEGPLVRAYSFIAGGSGYTVLLGLTGDPQLSLNAGWSFGNTVIDEGGLKVIEVHQ